SYFDKIVAFNASEYSGSLSTTEETKELLDKISNTNSKIIELKNKIKKETNFNEKVSLNMELKKLNDTLKELEQKL
ncbi:MAG: DUF4391 domain-containing protein, partial [Nanoarchaeota archaeon]|nr:DUF4391 domain-containing protein [Nanoarchaeota archaeon]